MGVGGGGAGRELAPHAWFEGVEYRIIFGQNLGQFDIIWAILSQNLGQFHTF